ncbi:MAG: SH3 domain-containing protein [Clostridiaceae bacterium]
MKKIYFSLPAMLITFLLLTGVSYADAVKTGIVTGDVVNLRAQANTSSKILKQLVKGTKVSIVESEKDWYQVSYNDSTGWISGNYILIRDESISAGVVTGSVVNVRSKPDTSGEILTKLNKGARVDIFEQSGDWYRISIGEDRYGWIHKDYISIRNESVSRGTADTAASIQSDATADQKATQENQNNASIADSEKTEALRQEIIAYAKTLLGIKYVYGGSSKKGFDCSGFVGYVFEHFGISLERSSKDMGNNGKTVKKADLKPGDLVFFDTNGGLNAINHVGIYIGNNKFIHASSGVGRKVTISSLSDSFYLKKYMRARDYLTD